MNLEIGTEAAQFLEKEYINGIIVAVLPTSLSSYLRTLLLPFPCLYFHLLFSSSRLLYSPLILLCCQFSFFPSLSQYFLFPPCTCLSLCHSSLRFFPVIFLFTFLMFFFISPFAPSTGLWQY